MRDIEMRLIIIPIIILTATIVIADAFPIQSQNRQKKSRNTKQKKTVVSTKISKNAHFNFLKMLHEEKPVKGGKLLGVWGCPLKACHPIKLKSIIHILFQIFPKHPQIMYRCF